MSPILWRYYTSEFVGTFGFYHTHEGYVQVWDLIKLGDHLSARKDVDPSRIGITGESLGGTMNHVCIMILNYYIDFTLLLEKTPFYLVLNTGMHAWFAAFVDTRYSVVVPIIGIQVRTAGICRYGCTLFCDLFHIKKLCLW